MLDFGASNTHANAVQFLDRDSLDGMTSYSVALQIRSNLSAWNTNEILGKFTTNSGWSIRGANTETLQLRHGDGSATSAATTSTTPLVVDTTYSFVATWDGTVVAYYLDGVADGGDASFTRGVDATNAAPFELGNTDIGLGCPVSIGHFMVWPNYILTSGEIAQYTAGIIVPAADKLEFWHKGIEVPGRDEITVESGTTLNTVVLKTDPSDSYFPSARLIESWRQSATQYLLEKSFENIIYRLRVPFYFQDIELLEPMNVSHDALLLAASRLASLGDKGDDALFDNWRRGLYIYVGRTVLWDEREIEMRFLEHEPGMSTYFASERAPFGSADDYPGVARADLGGTLDQTRTTKAYIEQENNQIIVDGEGNFYATVGPNASKVNHTGLLTEDAIANLIDDPCFANGLASYSTVTAGGSTVTVVTDRLAIPASLTGNSIECVGAASSDAYFVQTKAVLAADGFARVMFITSGRQNGNPNWIVQRSFDSWYWNDSTETWQSGAIANATPAPWDSVNSLEIAITFWSKPIPIDQNENWTVSVGKTGVVETYNFYALNLTKGPYRQSLNAGTTDTEADEFTDELDVDVADPVRQLCSAERGTITLDMVALQDGGDLEDDDELALFTAQYGDDEKEFYVVLYQKLSGENVRFSFERWTNVATVSTLDVRATYDISIVKDTTYRVTARFTSATTEDVFGASRIRINVDGVNGVDAITSGIFSTSERFTKLWFGCAPSATGYKPASNYISLFRIQPRVITDDEVLSA